MQNRLPTLSTYETVLHCDAVLCSNEDKLERVPAIQKETMQIIMQKQSWCRGCNERYHKIRILRQEHKQTNEIKVKACIAAQSKFYK